MAYPELEELFICSDGIRQSSRLDIPEESAGAILDHAIESENLFDDAAESVLLLISGSGGAIEKMPSLASGAALAVYALNSMSKICRQIQTDAQRASRGAQG